MKIVSVDVMQVPSGNAGSSRGAWSPVVVRVNTDEGISGFGEVGLAYGKGWRAGFGMVQDFAEQIIGMDPMNNEQIWETIFRKTFWGMGGGTVVNAGISGIDIALWDIKGKALGVPIHTLLGGKMNDNLRTYASQLQYNWGTNLTKQRLVEPEEYAEVTRVAMAEGYDAIKVDPIVIPGEEGKPWKITGPLENRVIRTVYNRVAAMREVGGEDLDIIIEMHSNTDTTAAIQIGHALEDLRIFYYEEPCHPLNVQNMVEVRNAVNIPIATGERIYTRWGYRDFFEKRAHRCHPARYLPVRRADGGQEDLRHVPYLRLRCADPRLRQPHLQGGGPADRGGHPQLHHSRASPARSEPRHAGDLPVRLSACERQVQGPRPARPGPGADPRDHQEV